MQPTLLLLVSCKLPWSLICPWQWVFCTTAIRIKSAIPEYNIFQFIVVDLRKEMDVVQIRKNTEEITFTFTWNIVGYLKPSTERTYLLTKRPSTRMMIKIDAAPIFILDPLDSRIKSLLDQNVCGHPFQSRITNVDHTHKGSSSESWSHYFKFHQRCILLLCSVNCAGSVRLVTGAVVQSVEQWRDSGQSGSQAQMRPSWDLLA